MFFLVSCINGSACIARFLMSILTIPIVPKNSPTSVRCWHISQLIIFCMQLLSGIHPSYIHLCLTTTAELTQMRVLCLEKAPPACLILCITLLTFCRCSQMKCWIPLFSRIISYAPFLSWYRDVSPLTGMSSTKGIVMSGILLVTGTSCHHEIFALS